MNVGSALAIGDTFFDATPMNGASQGKYTIRKRVSVATERCTSYGQ